MGRLFWRNSVLLLRISLFFVYTPANFEGTLAGFPPDFCLFYPGNFSHSTKPAPAVFGLVVEIGQHRPSPAPRWISPHPLQNRVPRVRVLLPLPKKSGIASAVPDFFVSVRKDSATRHGCAPRSASRGASACQWHASYEPTEAAAERSPMSIYACFPIRSPPFSTVPILSSSRNAPGFALFGLFRVRFALFDLF